MRILQICNNDITGGAGKAAYRLHLGLLQQNVASRMLVQQKDSNDLNVYGPDTAWQRSMVRMRWHIDQLPLHLFYQNRPPSSFTTAWVPSNRTLFKKIQNIDPEIIHMHWINAGMLSVGDIAQIKQPVVWTLHDMWAFTGGCHYDENCGGYREQCGECNLLASTKQKDLSRYIWQQKQRKWSDNEFTIVTPSHWLADCAQQSSLLRNKRIEVIHNGLDTSLYRPLKKDFARQVFGLPQDKKLILFGALSATSSMRKGFKELSEALPLIVGENISLVVFGASQPQNAPNFDFETYYLGHLYDDYSLALLYNAADVFVLPSKQDNLPNMVIESLSCGVPCIAFDIGGMSDMIDHKQNGFLAQPFESQDLAQGIMWILEDKSRWQRLSKNAREKVEQEFTLKLQAERYLALYEELANETNL